MAHSLAPYSIGTAKYGTSPLSMTLTRSVKAEKSAILLRWTMVHQWKKVARAETIWPTRSSSMKRQDSFSNMLFRGDCRNYRPISWFGRLRFSGAEGCFSSKALSVSLSWGAKPSAEASSLTVPLTSPSANLDATLPLRVLCFVLNYCIIVLF